MEKTNNITPVVLRKEREKGFVVAGSMLLMTVTLISLYFIFFYQDVMRTQQDTKVICHKLSAAHQKKMRSLLSRLLKMNPGARALRKEYQTAKQRLAKAMASATPPAIAAAKAHFIYVQMKRTAYDSKQKLILAQASSETLHFKIALGREIKMRVGRDAHFEIIGGPLAVRPDVAFDIAPEYLLKQNFSQDQKSGAMWRAAFQNYLSNRFVFQQQQIVQLPLRKKWEASCATTIEERRPREFFIAMTAAKY